MSQYALEVRGLALERAHHRVDVALPRADRADVKRRWWRDPSNPAVGVETRQALAGAEASRAITLMVIFVPQGLLGFLRRRLNQ